MPFFLYEYFYFYFTYYSQGLGSSATAVEHTRYLVPDTWYANRIRISYECAWLAGMSVRRWMEEGGTWRIGGSDPIEHRSYKFKHNESVGTRTKPRRASHNARRSSSVLLLGSPSETRCPAVCPLLLLLRCYLVYAAASCFAAVISCSR